MAGAGQRADRGQCGSFDRVAKPSRSDAEILAARRSRRYVPLGLAGVGTGSQKLSGQCRVFRRDLIDRPDAGGRLAEFTDGVGRLAIGAPEFSHQRGSPRHEILEWPSIQGGGVHAQQCDFRQARPMRGGKNASVRMGSRRGGSGL